MGKLSEAAGKWDDRASGIGPGSPWGPKVLTAAVLAAITALLLNVATSVFGELLGYLVLFAVLLLWAVIYFRWRRRRNRRLTGSPTKWPDVMREQ